MKIFKTFPIDSTDEINSYLEVNKQNLLNSLINIFADKVVIVLEDDKHTADQINSLEELFKSSQGQKTNAVLSITQVDHQIELLNAKSVDLTTDEGKEVAAQLTELNAKKAEFQDVVENQNFYLIQIQNMIDGLRGIASSTVTPVNDVLAEGAPTPIAE